MHIQVASSPNWSSSHALDVTSDGVGAYAGHLTVTVLCSKQQRILRCLGPHRARVTGVAFIPCSDAGQLVVGCDDGSVRRWDWQRGVCLASSRAKHKAGLSAVLVPSWPNAPAVFGDSSGRLLLWNIIGSSSKPTILTTLSGGSKIICLATAAASASDSADADLQPPQRQLIAAGCSSGVCVVVDVSTGSQLVSWTAHTAPVHSIHRISAAVCSSTGSSCGSRNSSDDQAWQQQQQQAAQHDKNIPHDALQQPTTDAISSSDDCSNHVGAADSNSKECHYLVTAGADRCIKMWWLPSMSVVAAAGESLCHVDGSGSTVSGAQPDSGTAEPQNSATSATSTAFNTGHNLVTTATPPTIPLPPLLPSTSVPAAVPSLPQLISSATVRGPPDQLTAKQQRSGSSSSSSGHHSTQYYGAVALIPGSVSSSSSGVGCLVLVAGTSGGVQLTALSAGNMACPCVLLKPPHSRMMYQVVVLPDWDEPGGGLQKQQQQKQHSYKVYSISMDRSLVMSELLLQAVPDAAAAAAPLAPADAPVVEPHALEAAGHSTASDAASSSASSSSPAVKVTKQQKASGGATGSSKKGSSKKDAAAILNYPAAGKHSSSSAGSSSNLHVQGLRVLWSVQGLGGYAFAAAVQAVIPADKVTPHPGYTPVRVAVGCGDKTIRVVTLGVRAAAAAAAAAGDGSSSGAHSAGHEIPEAASTEEPPKPAAATAVASQACAAASSEVNSSVHQYSLLWKNIQDQVLAVAWHPTNSRILAFGCRDGSLGVYDVISDTSKLFRKRHGGPVTALAWHNTPRRQQQQQCSAVLYSLGGEGCLLAWEGLHSTTAADLLAAAAAVVPTDVGVLLQQKLQAFISSSNGVEPSGDGAAAAAAAAAAGSYMFWSCLDIHASGCFIAVGSNRGQLLVCQHRPTPAAAAEVGGSSSAASWRKTPGSSTSGSCWNVAGCISTGTGLAVTAVAWQPAEYKVAGATAAGDVHEPTLLLLAAVDKQTVYLFGCHLHTADHSHNQQQSSDNSRVLMSCIVKMSSCSTAGSSSKGQQQQQQQLTALSWSDSSTLCVADNGGSIHVMKVLAGLETQQQQQVELTPSHRLTGHMSGVTCLSAFPGWPGLMVSGSADQSVRTWQVGKETGEHLATPTLLTSAAAALGGRDRESDAAAATEESDVAMAAATAATHSSAAEAGTVAAANSHLEAVEELIVPVGQAEQPDVVPQPQPASAVQAPYEGASNVAITAAATPSSTAAADQVLQDTGAAPPQAGPPQAPTAPTAATSKSHAAKAAIPSGSSSSSGPVSTRHWKQFVLPGSRSFLPPLPDVSDPVTHHQVLLDVLAVAEAMYPPTAAAAAAAAGSSEVADTINNTAKLQRELSSQAAGLLKAGAKQKFLQTQQQQQQQHEQEEEGLVKASASEVLRQQLSAVVGADYQLGSWLPTMTADVPELLLQYQQQQQHQPQQVQEPDAASLPGGSSGVDAGGDGVSGAANQVSKLAVNQIGMMQYLIGNTKGFLESAVSADVITHDVVTLAAAGGEEAYKATARLAAAKLAHAGQTDAAVVYLLATGDYAEAVNVLREGQRGDDADAVYVHWVDQSAPSS